MMSKSRPFEPPPGIRDQAIGQKAVVQKVTILRLFSPFAAEVKRILGRQQAFARLDAGGRSSVDVVEFSGLGLGVVLRTVAIQFLAVSEALVMNFAASHGLMGRLVVIDLVGCEQRILGLDPRISAKVQYFPIGFLLIRRGFSRFRPVREP